MADFTDLYSCDSGDLSVSNDLINNSDDNLASRPDSHPRYLAAPEFSFRKTNSHQNGIVKVNSSKCPSNPNAIFQSTTFLHAYERPSELPQKDPSEAKHHRIQCEKMMQNILKKHQKKISLLLAEQEKRQTNDSKACSRINYWLNEVIPKWDKLEGRSLLFETWWFGIPSYVRGQVWQLIIGNPLGITRDLFEICLAQSRHTLRQLDRARLLVEGFDFGCEEQAEFPTLPALPTSLMPSRRLHSLPIVVDKSSRCPSAISPRACSAEASVTPRRVFSTPSSPLMPPLSPSTSGDLSSSEAASLQIIRLDVSRTFPNLGVFQPQGLHNRSLHDLLAAFVSYQPSLGYLQGMSFIAAILLLILNDVYTAFVAFATLMNRPSFYAFYSLDESEFASYFGAFDSLLKEQRPHLFAHLKSCGLDCKLYLFDWLFTVFSRSLPLEVDLRIWDLFLRDGEAALLLAALGILRMYEERLLHWDFDNLASFLTGPMPESMSPDDLTSCMRSLDLSTTDIKRAIENARKNRNVSSTAPRIDLDPRKFTEALNDQSDGRQTPGGRSGMRNNDSNSKFPSFRRKTATSVLIGWNADVRLDFPKRELL